MKTRQNIRTQPVMMTETEGTMVSPQQIVLIPQLERTVGHFRGRGGHQESDQFCDDLNASWSLPT